MIHLELIVPTELSAEVTARLEADPRVTHLVVLAGAGRRPPGDLVSCDVAREAAAEVLEALHELGLDGAQGPAAGISVQEVHAALSRDAVRAEQAAPGAPVDGIVWPVVLERARDAARGSWSFHAFLALATLIAAVAVVTDSAVLVVGAMVVGPEFGPVSALAVAAVLGRARLAVAAVRLLLVGFAGAVLTTTAVALVARAAGWIGPADLTRPRPMTGFIWTPDRWSLVVALLAGAAGVLSITSGAATALVGVFISVTTVPAAGNLALALALAVPSEIGGALAQLGVNLSGMTVAGVAVLALQRRLTRRPARG